MQGLEERRERGTADCGSAEQWRGRAGGGLAWPDETGRLAQLSGSKAAASPQLSDTIPAGGPQTSRCRRPRQWGDAPAACRGWQRASKGATPTRTQLVDHEELILAALAFHDESPQVGALTGERNLWLLARGTQRQDQAQTRGKRAVAPRTDRAQKRKQKKKVMCGLPKKEENSSDSMFENAAALAVSAAGGPSRRKMHGGAACSPADYLGAAATGRKIWD